MSAALNWIKSMENTLMDAAYIMIDETDDACAIMDPLNTEHFQLLFSGDKHGVIFLQTQAMRESSSHATYWGWMTTIPSAATKPVTPYVSSEYYCRTLSSMGNR